MKTSKGCVQGSIGGPILWNILLDPLLREINTGGIRCQAFADDVILVFTGDTGKEIEDSANTFLARVQEWGVKNKLRFGPLKTTAMIVTKKLKFDLPRLVMGGVDVAILKKIKLLGVIIDHRLTFNTHVAVTCTKAIKVYNSLSRAASVHWGLHTEIIRIIYRAAVEPIILYCASVWAPASRKKGIQKSLNAVQRGFAQKICRAYRTTSLNLALLLSGLLPLDIRIRENASLYEIKRGLSGTVVQDMELSAEVERKTAFTSNPHPADNMVLEFMCLADQDDVNNYVTQPVRIFTDGSRIDGGVGVALFMETSAAETKAVKFKLSSHCTVYQAELLAICQATKLALIRNETNFALLSDSRSALETVTNAFSSHPLATLARQNIREMKHQQKEIAMFWIKAHAGFDGNEEADRLAKEAALCLNMRPDYDACPLSFVKKKIRHKAVVEWKQRYEEGTTATTTKLFFPDAMQAYGIVKTLNLDGILTQILTGHGGFSDYLYKFKCKETSNCICDPEVPENIEHIIINCPVYGHKRYETELEIDYEISTPNIKTIINDEKKRDIFLKFCRTIATEVINRNK